MKARYIVWVVAIFVAVAWAPAKVWAQAGDPSCDDYACGGEPDGQGGCFPYQCDSDPYDPGCTGPNAPVCGLQTTCCGGECITGGCPGGTLTCPAGKEPNPYYGSGASWNGLPTCALAGNPTCCTAISSPLTCTPETGCSSDHPGYGYSYTPSDYPTCTFGPPWPTWPTNYSVDNSCGGTCTPRTGCSGDHPGYRYSYTPSDYPTCTFGPPWPSWPSDYSLSTACGASPTPTPAPAYIRGRVYNDTNNTCVLGTRVLVSDPNVNPRVYSYPYGWETSDPLYNSLVRIGVNQQLSANYSGTGLYLREQGGAIQIRASETVASTLYLNLATLPTGYRCSDGPGCPTCPVRTGVYAEGTRDNFFITNSPTPAPSVAPSPAGAAWWQAEGAGVYAGSQAGGVVVRSDLPSLTSLILPGSGGTSGVLVRGSGTVGLGSGSLSSEEWSALARYRGKQMDYNYFAANMGVLKNSLGEWTLNNEINLTTYPSGSDFGYRNGDGIVVDPITVGVGESYVVFVNGDLSIEDNITVVNGGFLAFIVNGNVVVSPTVDTLQGILVMDGDFVTDRFDPSGTFDDVALETEGTVVAWGSFSLGRELGMLNNSTPAEKFSYRPDFLKNMPDKMKTFAMEWQEVAAGSFE